MPIRERVNCHHSNLQHTDRDSTGARHKHSGSRDYHIAEFFALVCCILSVGCSDEKGHEQPAGAEKTLEQAQELLGKSKSEVLAALGEPDRIGTYDSTIINENDHTKSEVEEWRESTNSKRYEYGDIRLDFNMNGIVREVTKRASIELAP